MRLLVAKADLLLSNIRQGVVFETKHVESEAHRAMCPLPVPRSLTKFYSAWRVEVPVVDVSYWARSEALLVGPIPRAVRWFAFGHTRRQETATTPNGVAVFYAGSSGAVSGGRSVSSSCSPRGSRRSCFGPGARGRTWGVV